MKWIVKYQQPAAVPIEPTREREKLKAKICDSCGALAPDVKKTRITPGDSSYYEMEVCRMCHNDLNAQFQLDQKAFGAYMQARFRAFQARRTSTPIGAPTRAGHRHG